MSIVERLFQAAYDRLNPERAKALPPSAAIFGDFRERLSYLASSLSPLKLIFEESLGSAGQEWCLHGKCLLLPSFIAVFTTTQENYDVYKFRLIVELLGIEHSLRGRTLPPQYTFFEAKNEHLDALLAATPFSGFVSGVASRLREVIQNPDMPSAKPSAHAEAMLRFCAPSKPDIQGLALALGVPSRDEKEPSEETKAMLLKRRNPKALRQISLNEEEMNPLVHSFEKIHTLDDYTGGNKQIDDADEMKDHGRALQDLDLNTVIRTNKSGSGGIEGSVLQDAEFEPSASGVIVPKLFRYREWNARKGLYHADWCVVREGRANSIVPESMDAVRTNIRGARDDDGFDLCRAKGRILRERLTHFFNTYQWQRRQPEGPELDLAALIESRVEQKRGGQPSNEIYLSRVRTDLNFALTVLCDSSLSTDSWIAGRQVCKVIQDAAVILSYGLEDIGCQWSVAAFNSFTRHECHYLVLKDFDEGADVVRQNIGALKPDGYTRIGPAMRHAGYLLSRRRARRNMLIVITDAKPSDYDRYDGAYGVQDVRRAVSELKARNISSYAVTIADGRRDRAREMFGAATASCMTPDQLSDMLFGFFAGFISRRDR